MRKGKDTVVSRRGVVLLWNPKQRHVVSRLEAALTFPLTVYTSLLKNSIKLRGHGVDYIKKTAGKLLPSLINLCGNKRSVKLNLQPFQIYMTNHAVIPGYRNVGFPPKLEFEYHKKNRSAHVYSVAEPEIAPVQYIWNIITVENRNGKMESHF